MNAPPIVIIGPPRSGTTLLATMLNTHSRIFVANETKVLVTLLPRASRYGNWLSEAVAARIIGDLERNELADYAPLPSAAAVLQRLLAPTVPYLIRELFQRLAEREGKSRWGEKTAVAYRHLDVIREAYPDARLIGLERDPEEVAASYARVLPKWGGVGGLMHWLDFKRTLAHRGGSCEILLVPYRKLVSDPAAALKAVCAYVGEGYEPGMLEFYNTKRAREIRGDAMTNGVGRALYVPELPHSQPCRGLQGRIFRACVRRANPPEPQHLSAPLWERVVRVFLFLRAGMWELLQPEVFERTVREIKLRTGLR